VTDKSAPRTGGRVGSRSVGALLRGRPKIVTAVALVLVLGGISGCVLFSCGHNGIGAGHRTSVDAGSTSTASTDIKDSASAILQAQSVALMAGDERGWLRDVDSRQHDLIDTYKLVFHNLRAMHVSKWETTSVSRGLIAGQFDVDVSYCFVTPSCAVNQQEPLKTTMSVSIKDEWDLAGQKKLLIENFDFKYDFLSAGPLPWQVTELRTAVGARVLVAAPVDIANWIPKAIPLAEQAAAVADRYSRWAALPGPYVIYLGRSADLEKWYGIGRDPHDPQDELGLTVSVAPYDEQVVIRLPDAADPTKGDGLRTVIQHELGHVVTLIGRKSRKDDTLVEGIAEYIAHVGQPLSRSWNGGLQWYLRSGKWNGNVLLDVEIKDRDPRVRGAAYGIGYLTMHHLVDRYGEDRTFTFFAGLERLGSDVVNDWSLSEFGASWQAVNQDCAQYIRSVVGD
jgi:hypothetical protein